MAINFLIPLGIALNIISALSAAILFLHTPWIQTCPSFLKNTTPWNIIVFLGLDILIFLSLAFCFKKNDAAAAVPEPLPYLGLVRDVVDFIILAVGLALQQYLDPGCWTCFWFVLATSVLISTFSVIIKPRISLRLIDHFISLFSVLLVFLAKSILSTTSDKKSTGLLVALIVVSVLCFFTLCYRNYHEELTGGNPDPVTVVGLLVNRVYPAIRTGLANFWAHLGACLVAIYNCLFGTNINSGGEEEKQPLVESVEPDLGQTTEASTGPEVEPTLEEDCIAS